MFNEKTTLAARGKWRGICMEFGIPEKALRNKHGPCPLCTSEDNFRFDDKEGSGSWICTCGAGTGMDLVLKYTGKGFQEAATMIDGILGNITKDTPKPDISPEILKNERKTVYKSSSPIEVGDLAHVYLASRGIDELVYPKALRFVDKLRDGDGGIRPAMLAMVGVYGEKKYSSIHRTYLKPDGSGKAEMAAPRKMMAGTIPDGACVALSDYTGGPLGIAEGIETAMSASALYDMPVWAALNTALMRKWQPPEGCEEVAIFADRDPKFGGEAAAYTLAHRLAVQGVAVTVHVPEIVGQDYNDILLAKLRRDAKMRA